MAIADVFGKIGGAVTGGVKTVFGIPWYYKLIFMVVAFIGVFAFGYHKGNAHGVKAGDDKVAAYEASHNQVTAKVNEGQVVINDRVTTKYVDRVKKIYIERGNTDALIPTIPNLNDPEYRLPAGWVYTYNVSVKGGNADASRVVDGTSSEVDPNSALRVIARNNYVCRIDQGRLEDLQAWIRESKANVDKANAELDKKKHKR
jgi:hypothetical protein